MCWESSKQSLSYWKQLCVTWLTAGSVYACKCSVSVSSRAEDVSSASCYPVTTRLHMCSFQLTGKGLLVQMTPDEVPPDTGQATVLMCMSSECTRLCS